MSNLRDPATNEASSNTPNVGTLSRQIAQCFNLDELQALCLELGVDYEELAGTTKTPRIASLLEELQWQDRIPPLLALLERERPRINWQTPVVPTSRGLRNRHNVLRNVRATWIDGFLHHSLSEAVALELDLTYETTAVARTTIFVAGQAEQPVDQPIRDVFEEYGRALLILGNPGSGKTITLLQLAETLIQDAEQDPGQPIPVILNLSSWGESRLPLIEWLVEEIFVQYGVARKLSSEWIAQDQWLYLLDGLDEVADAARAACVAAINAFRADHPAEIVVCSRIKDYDALSEQLNLATAVRIEPLSDSQIRSYLSQGAQLDSVRSALLDDPFLDHQAHSPLFLNIMMVALQGQTPALLAEPATPASFQRRLFATYIETMFARRPLPEDGRYTTAQAKAWLTRLAQGMKSHDQSLFYLERLQPNWLSGRGQQLYLLLVGFVCGSFIGLFNAVPVAVRDSDWREILLTALLFTICGGISVPLGVLAVSRVRPPWLRALSSGIVAWLGFAVLTVVAAQLLGRFGLGQDNLLTEWLLIGFFRGLDALFFGALIGLRPNIEVVEQVALMAPSAAQLRRKVPRGLLLGALTGFIIGIIFGMAASLIYNFTVRTDVTPASALFFGLVWGTCLSLVSTIAGAIVGIMAGIVSAFLQRRRIERSLQPNQGVTNSLRRAFSVLAFSLFPLALFMILGFLWLGREGIARVLVIAGVALPVIFLYFGGLAALQHVCLRLLLGRQGVLPLRLVSFLDAMGERILLRRVGGGWIFMHRALQEHLAAQEYE